MRAGAITTPARELCAEISCSSPSETNRRCAYWSSFAFFAFIFSLIILLCKITSLSLIE